MAITVDWRNTSTDWVEPTGDLPGVIELLMVWVEPGVNDADTDPGTVNAEVGSSQCRSEVGVGAVVGDRDLEVLLDTDNARLVGESDDLALVEAGREGRDQPVALTQGLVGQALLALPGGGLVGEYGDNVNPIVGRSRFEQRFEAVREAVAIAVDERQRPRRLFRRLCERGRRSGDGREQADHEGCSCQRASRH